MKNTIIMGAFVLALISIGITGKMSHEANKAETIGSKEEKIVALSTFTILADMVSEVGGDKVESISLTKPGVEIHGYEPTPQDLVQAAKADIIFENGLNLELWSAKLRSSIPDVKSVVLSEGVEVVSIAEGDYLGKPNPHAWMSPKQGLIYIQNIQKALSEIAPEHSEYFAKNAQAYSAKLRTLDTTLNESLRVLPEGSRTLVSCEGAFTYLTNDYNLHEVYLWAINDESGGSPQHIARVIDQVKERKVPAVFCESTVEPKIQDEVIAATGAKFGGVLYVDSLSSTDGPAYSYLSLLEHTVKTIISGLSTE